MIRVDSGMSVSRFTAMLGIPERTWRRWAQREARGPEEKGPWPRPAQNEVEAAVLELAAQWPTWGHPRIAALLRARGFDASDSTVQRVMAGHDLLNPARDGSQRRALEAERQRALTPVPTRRNQVWVLDVGEVDTPESGIWRVTGCADFFSRYEFPWRVAETANRQDAVEAIGLAIDEAEELLGSSLAEDLIDNTTGQPRRIRLVTDSRPAFKARAFIGFVNSTGLFQHVRVPSLPKGQGWADRAFGPLAYEYLYQYNIADGAGIATAAEEFRQFYNWIRPHDDLDMERPGERYLELPNQSAGAPAPVSP